MGLGVRASGFGALVVCSSILPVRGEGLEKVWMDPVGQQLAVQLVPTGIQLLQLWDPF